jgi:hypothetical protein
VSNSGCYYAVNNDNTKLLFAEMIYQGDRVSACRSHQAALHTVMSELSSLHGLRVKNLRDDHEKFPSTCLDGLRCYAMCPLPFMRVSHHRSFVRYLSPSRLALPA